MKQRGPASQYLSDMTENVQVVANPGRARGPMLKAAGWGLLVFLLSVGAQWLIYEKFLDDPGGMRLISPVIASIVAALFTWRLQIMERDRAKATLGALQTISDMNHHIRNALQVISCASYAGSKPNQNMVEAVSRIEWTLREILPKFSSTGFRTDATKAHPKRTEE